MKLEKDMILFVTQNVYKDLIKCVKIASPNEACGLVFGEANQIKNVNFENDYFYHLFSKKFKCLKSSEKSPVAFILSNFEELFEISSKELQGTKYQLLSIFHSHPSGAYPSGTDFHYMKTFHDSGIRTFKYTVWTIMDATNFNLNGFLFMDNEIVQIDIQNNIEK